MLTIKGKHNEAIVYTGAIEDTAKEQIKTICDQAEFSNSKIRIMPDVHAGAGCTIGTTMTIKDKVVPNLVGIDGGCGVLVLELKENEIDFEKLDKVINENVPAGRNVRDTPHTDIKDAHLDDLYVYKRINEDLAARSIGTLGGGNHFIEVAKGERGNLYLTIHSGSRHLGLEVANYYQDLAYNNLTKGKQNAEIAEAIADLKKQGRHKEIEKTIMRMKAQAIEDTMPKGLHYLTGDDMQKYLHDMQIVQNFASINRWAMAEVILAKADLSGVRYFTTVHNYIASHSMILRKGAVSALKGEEFIVPINMKDGSLICRGKGNPEWNCSAPHGAGRLMSRNVARKSLSLDDFKAQMQGVYSTSINESTLDEAPSAYKPVDAIVSNISPTADVIEQIKPVYNFKASE
jgi:RNA-splicing ligase RtcB